MISGNTEKFMTPLRQISGKVEVIDTSTTSQSGKVVRLEGCAVGAPLEVKLSGDLTQKTRPSRNLLDTKSGISYITFNAAGSERARYGWVLDLPPGDYYAHGESVNYTSGYIYLYIIDENNNTIGDAKYLASGGALQPNVGAFTLAEGQRGLLLDYTTSHTQADAEKFLYEDINLQVEAGSLPTAYEPFGTVQVGAEVRQYGKNLFDYKTYPLINYYWNHTTGKITPSSSYSCSMLMPCKHLRGKTITINEAVYDVAYGGSGGMVFYTGNTTDGFIKGAGGNGHTYPVPDEAEYFGITVPRAFASGETIQIEIGEYETDFEAFREPRVFQANSGGIVSGITAYAINTLIATGDNTTLTASYSIEVSGDTYTAKDKLQSITIDRTGESKFFGFGISQKATIKLIDKECMCGLASGDKLTVLFDDEKVSPAFHIENVSRDEKSGNVSVEAQDALFLATKHTINEIELPADYTIGELADAVAAFLSIDIVRPDLSEFSTLYEGGANFDGSETAREVLNFIAEATQTIYFINRDNALVFKRPSMDEEVAWEIDRTQYFDLTNKSQVELTGICSATELGDNVEATNGRDGITQYVRDNPLWELREDIGDLVDNAVAAIAGLTISQFNCSWRGCYLVEPGDKIALTTKDGNTIYSYLINDKIEYTGGYKQVSHWDSGTKDTTHANPSTLGEMLKQTYAKVDKANKQIDIVASEASATKEAVAALQLSTGLIEASVSDYKKATSEAIGDINGELEGLSQSVKATMTSDEVKIEIQKELSNGVDKVSTSKGYSFSDSGLAITSSQNNLSTHITEDGMEVKKGGQAVLTASNEGVEAIDLKATTFLVIGKNSRFEDYDGGKRTACFWIGR